MRDAPAGFGAPVRGPPLPRALHRTPRRNADVIVSFDQELLVLRIEHGALDVVAREAPHRLLRLPEGQQEEFRAPVDHAAKRQHAAVSRRGAVLREAGCMEIVEVGFRVVRLVAPCQMRAIIASSFFGSAPV